MMMHGLANPKFTQFDETKGVGLKFAWAN